MNRFSRARAAGVVAISSAVVGGAITATAATGAPGAETAPKTNTAFVPSVAFRWNRLGIAAVRHETNPRPPVVARSMFLISDAMFEAWAAYDKGVAGAVTGQRFDVTGTLADQERAIAGAAFLVIKNQFPKFESNTRAGSALLKFYGGALNSNAAEGTPDAVAKNIATAILNDRRNDGSNQANGYAEPEDSIYGPYVQSTTPGRWQALKVPTGTKRNERGEPFVDPNDPQSFIAQAFVTPHWGGVKPFAMTTGNQFRAPKPPILGDTEPYTDAKGLASTGDEAFRKQMDEVRQISATLTDQEKIIVEYWADGPHSETTPGHWNVLAQQISVRDRHSTEKDVKMYFSLNAALFDASISGWDTKRFYDTERPVTAIQRLSGGEEIFTWGGPNRGTVKIKGSEWHPYQKDTFITPPFPEYVSGHSIFSGAAATALKEFTGSDRFYDAKVTLPWDSDRDGEPDVVGQWVVEPGGGRFERLPREKITLRWDTFSAALAQAGRSRILGGIHIQDGDLRGRDMGRKVGALAYKKASALWGQK